MEWVLHDMESMPARDVTTPRRRRGRPVDHARRAARRRQIVAAAFSCFAEHGYAGTSTAAICRAARIGSGTLFHQFPSKAAILVAVIEHGTQETRKSFAALVERDDPVQALCTWLDEVTAQVQDPRLAGFVRAVAAVVGEPAVTVALAADDEATIDGLTRLISGAQRAGSARRDLPPDRLAAWVALLVDGFLGRLASASAFSPDVEAPMLRAVVLQLVGIGDRP